MARRKQGRPLLLLEGDIRERLVAATKQGAPVEVAATYAGVSYRAFQKWMARGRDELENREDGAGENPREQPFVDLWEEIQQARATAGVHSVQAVRRAIQGGTIIEESTKKYRDPVTGAVVEETVVRKTAPDWKAAAWFLERQQPAHFGKAAEKLEVTGEGGGPVQLTAQAANDLANRVFGHIGAVKAALETGPGTDVVDAEVVPD